MISVLNIILTILFLAGLGAFSYLAYFWIQHRLKVKELDELLAVVLEDVQTAGEAFQDYKKSSDIIHSEPGPDKYLSTLITVITKKLDGEVVLTADDFKRVELDDYVTLYIDTSTYDIVLRTQNSDMSDLSSYFNSKDEDIFH